jgi:hypothetical protein
MTVLSRVLYGSVTVKSFDIIPPETIEERDRRSSRNNKGSSAKGLIGQLVKGVRKFHPCDKKKQGSYTLPLNNLNVFENDLKVLKSPQVTELYPRKGNVHEFTAGPDGAALLDVLVPPYDVEDERDCSFYEKNNSFPWRKEDGRMSGFLSQMDQPDWFNCLAGQYKYIGQETNSHQETNNHQDLEMDTDYTELSV